MNRAGKPSINTRCYISTPDLPSSQRYMAEVQAQASERHRAAETARMAELQALDEARAQDEFRKRVVQEARRQMLREHAAVLVSTKIGSDFSMPVPGHAGGCF